MIQGIIFDYGGTIDTNALHWSEVLWEGYQHVGIPVSKEEFRQSYVVAERALAKHPYIRPEHNFLDLLTIKCDIETKDLMEKGIWKVGDEERKRMSDAVAMYCYEHVLKVLEVSRPVIETLSKKYPLVLVSNFYGNIETILKDFRLEYFQRVIESAVVGIRKPDPQQRHPRGGRQLWEGHRPSHKDRMPNRLGQRHRMERGDGGRVSAHTHYT